MKCCSMQWFSVYKRVNDQYSVYRGGESDIKSVLILFSHLGLVVRKPKTCLRVFRKSEFQTGLLSYTDWLEN